MEPFTYNQPQSAGNRRLIGLVLAIMLAVWYFDIIPEAGIVPTGGLDTDVSNPNLDDEEFLSMLDALPTDAIVDNTQDAGPPQQNADDPLLAALASQAEPLAETFPEFGDPQPPEAANEAPGTQAGGSGIQQAGFAPAAATAAEAGVVQAVLTPEVAAALRKADQWLTDGETLEAHAALSRVYWKQPEFRTQISDRIEKTAAEIYANPSAHFAEPYVVAFGDTLESIAQKYQVPWQYLARLNGTSPETLQAGQKLKVLNGPFGVVVDLDKFEMTVHAHGWYVHRYQIGIGRDQSTPVGEFTVQNKLQNPEWNQPGGGVVAADDPQNPLGEYWIGLGEHIGIHGTINPESIGSEMSRGCIHLADGDIAEVFNLLGTGSKVVIRR